MILTPFSNYFVNLSKVDSIAKTVGSAYMGYDIEIYISGNLYVENYLYESERDSRFETLKKLIENA